MVAAPARLVDLVAEAAEPGEGVQFWLREVAKRLSLKEQSRKRPAVMDPADLPEEEDAPASGEMLSPRLDALRECMKGLDSKDRDLLAQRYETAEPIDAIAARFGQSSGYVKQRLFRLRKRLGACIDRRLGSASFNEPEQKA